jgi:GntR family transcriptional regulator, arabinose operon transcriptional repressor
LGQTSSNPAKPLYQSIFEQLGNDIAKGRYRPGQKLPSEAALIKRFQASRITVRHALRELQQQGLIDAVAGSGTYVRNVLVNSGEGLRFGLVIPNLGETEIFEPICQGIAGSPKARGHALLWPQVSTLDADTGKQIFEMCQQCIAHAVSGVFFAPLELSPRSDEANHLMLRKLAEAGIPVILLDHRPQEASDYPRCDLVGIDNHRAGYLAASHLLQLGASRLGFIAYQHQASSVKARIAGYRDALAQSDPVDATDRVFFLTPNVSLKLPEAARQCDAFVCANDRIAGMLMQALHHEEVRVPDDVRIVGIDDVRYANLLTVPLTTVRQPCRDIGETALRAMLERLEHPRMPARDVLLDCTLVVRQSCGSGNRVS